MPYVQARHAGILYIPPGQQTEQKTTYLIHLAMHLDLRREKSTELDYSYAWLLPMDSIPIPRRKQLAAMCHLVWDRNGKGRIPYGYKRMGAGFEKSGDNRGLFTLTPGAHGLSCATFILAVHDLAETILVAEADWVERPDDRRVLEILGTHIRDQADEQHGLRLLEAIKSDEACVRIRAEEVAGAYGSTDLPLRMKQAQTIGEHLLALLTLHMPEASFGRLPLASPAPITGQPQESPGKR